MTTIDVVTVDRPMADEPQAELEVVPARLMVSLALSAAGIVFGLATAMLFWKGVQPNWPKSVALNVSNMFVFGAALGVAGVITAFGYRWSSWSSVGLARIMWVVAVGLVAVGISVYDWVSILSYLHK